MTILFDADLYYYCVLSLMNFPEGESTNIKLIKLLGGDW